MSRLHDDHPNDPDCEVDNHPNMRVPVWVKCRGEAHSPEVAGNMDHCGICPDRGRNDPCPCGSGKKYKNVVEDEMQIVITSKAKKGIVAGQIVQRQVILTVTGKVDVANISPNEMGLQLDGDIREVREIVYRDNGPSPIEGLPKGSRCRRVTGQKMKLIR